MAIIICVFLVSLEPYLVASCIVPMQRNKYMCASIPRICVLLERSVERESKRLDVVSLTFELRVSLLKQ